MRKILEKSGNFVSPEKWEPCKFTNLSVKWSITIDTMINFGFDGHGREDGTSKRALNIFRHYKYTASSLGQYREILTKRWLFRC